MMDRHMVFSVPVRVRAGQHLAIKALVLKPCLSMLSQRTLEGFL